MKNILTTYLIVLTASVNAQSQADKTITVKGIVLDSDSIPIEHVHVINSRSYMFVASKASGKFSISAHIGDTLLFTHISYGRKEVVVNREDLLPIIMPISPFVMSPIIIQQNERALKNCENMVKHTVKQAKLNIKPKYKTSNMGSIYNPDANMIAGNPLGVLTLVAKAINKSIKKRKKKISTIREAYRPVLKDSLLRTGEIFTESQIDSIINSMSNREINRLNN